ncbi:MAG: DUF4476 domain-containing protein [Bacteroidaceae bacterium]|nr:DUF4476 domain-containing protein [Bacteroidaceae bacterium]
MKQSYVVVLLLLTLITTNVLAQRKDGPKRQPGRHRVEYADGKGRMRMRLKPMRKDDFQTLCEIVKKASFADRQKDIVTVACMGSYFSSKQCETLLSLFSFQDSKLAVLEILSPRLLEQEELVGILKQFSFSSSKDKAIEILTRSNRKEK